MFLNILFCSCGLTSTRSSGSFLSAYVGDREKGLSSEGCFCESSWFMIYMLGDLVVSYLTLFLALCSFAKYILLR